MGFYLKKSLRAGPLRFNLSKSGLGVSAGVPRFRVGLFGPRGHYVNMGRKGLYYRTTLGHRGGGSRGRSDSTPQVSPQPIEPVEAVQPILEDVTGATVLAMAASNPGELVEQLTTSQRKVSVWKGARAASVIVVILLLPSLPFGALVLMVVLGAGIWGAAMGHARRAVVFTT